MSMLLAGRRSSCYRKYYGLNYATLETLLTLDCSMGLFMMKELILKTSLAYDDKDFAAVVKDFVAGKSWLMPG